MHSPSIKHTRLREIQARRRFAVFLKQLCAALLFCGTDWAVVAFMVSHEQEAIKCVTIAFIILRPGRRRPVTS